MKALTFILATAALAAGTAAHAQQSTTFKPYVGVGVASAGNITTDKRHADAKIFGGVDFSNNLGVEAGYVNHERSAADRRSVRVKLTPKGQAVRNRVDALYDRQMRAIEQVAGLNADELDRINKSLTRLERYWTDQILYRL